MGPDFEAVGSFLAMVDISRQSAAHLPRSWQRRTLMWIKDPCAIFRNRNFAGSMDHDELKAEYDKWMKPRSVAKASLCAVIPALKLRASLPHTETLPLHPVTEFLYTGLSQSGCGVK